MGELTQQSTSERVLYYKSEDDLGKRVIRNDWGSHSEIKSGVREWQNVSQLVNKFAA